MRQPTPPILLALLSVLAAVPAQAQPNPQVLLGEWRLDPAASVEDLDGVRKFHADATVTAEDVREAVERRAQQMRLEITGGEVVFLQGDQRTSFHCTTRYENPPVILLACTAGDQRYTLTAVLLGDQKLKLLSSATDDMDIYVWRSAAAEPRVERTPNPRIQEAPVH